MTTTAAAVRDAMLTLVEAITPAVHAQTRFERFREQVDFRTWAEQHPDACLRRVSIRSTGDVTPPAVTNTDIEWVSTELECVVAYPTSGRFGANHLTELDDAISSDMQKIEHRIGTNGYAAYASQTAGATVTTIEASRDDGQAVTFGVLRLACGFYRVMT
jgi:hypothetical protein